MCSRIDLDQAIDLASFPTNPCMPMRPCSPLKCLRSTDQTSSRWSAKSALTTSTVSAMHNYTYARKRISSMLVLYLAASRRFFILPCTLAVSPHPPCRFRPAMIEVFGRTMLCKDLDTASMASRKSDFDCVTMEGDQVWGVYS